MNTYKIKPKNTAWTVSDHKVGINNLMVTTSCFIMSKMCFQVYNYPHTYVAIATCKNCFIVILCRYALY